MTEKNATQKMYQMGKSIYDNSTTGDTKKELQKALMLWKAAMNLVFNFFNFHLL